MHDAYGYVLPGELVAIMGPSGSGKTSLLNVLANRLNLSEGSRFSGLIECNARNVKGDDFSKFGAFVQQDDVLDEVMSPREALRFSAKIRSSKITDEEIEERVDKMIERLGLQDCADTWFGGMLIKGLSGGEKKRTCIGYELISNPSVLLLDEPTSGLDSHTALKIARLLK